MLAGAQLSCADATEGEASRVAMFPRLMAYDAVFGVDEAVLDGLDALERPYADVFGDVVIIGAHPGATSALGRRRPRAGPLRVVRTGSCRRTGARAPRVVDADEWERRRRRRPHRRDGVATRVRTRSFAHRPQ